MDNKEIAVYINRLAARIRDGEMTIDQIPEGLMADVQAEIIKLEALTIED